MKDLSIIKSIYDFGGLRVLAHKLEDRLLGADRFRKDIYEISMRANEEDYPRLLKDIFHFETGERLNLERPVTFNEKIQWLKIYDTTNEKTTLSDKYEVRSWVADIIGEEHLVPLLGVWDKYDDIDFTTLPKRFVLKCNHGCGYNFMVKDKDNIDHEKAKRCFEKWMTINDAFLFGFELQYRDIERRIIAEEYIEQLDGDLYDYKIHVFNGKPKIIQVIGDRNAETHSAKETFFDTEWNQVDLMYHTYDSFFTLPTKPDNLDEILDIAGRLGGYFVMLG